LYPTKFLLTWHPPLALPFALMQEVKLKTIETSTKSKKVRFI
jgi:hypothetical protein